MDKTPPPASSWLGVFASAAGLVASLGLGYLALSQRLPPPAEPGSDNLGAPPALGPCVMDRDGYWKGRLFGAAVIDVDWSGSALACDGHARPKGGGLRLFFAGPPDANADRLRLVLGIAADIGDLAGREHAASVTLIDEASSQFFHSLADRCFTRIRDVAPLAGDGVYRVEGDLYCAGAIASVSGENSVTLGDTAYAGRLTLTED